MELWHISKCVYQNWTAKRYNVVQLENEWKINWNWGRNELKKDVDWSWQPNTLVPSFILAWSFLFIHMACRTSSYHGTPAGVIAYAQTSQPATFPRPTKRPNIIYVAPCTWWASMVRCIKPPASNQTAVSRCLLVLLCFLFLLALLGC